MALRFLRQAAAADLELDPNSAGGIRIAGLGGVWQAGVLGFAGLDLSDDVISLTPRLPPQWRSVSFGVRWRGQPIQGHIAGGTVRVTISDGVSIDIRTAGGTHRLQSGKALEVRLESATAVAQ